MTNKERYQRAFSTLHASERIWEEIPMKESKKRYIPRIIAVCAAAVLILGLASVAYAADVGHIQRHIQVWTRGDQTDAVLEITTTEVNSQTGGYTEYSLTYEDADGVVHERGGGGLAVDMFGNERNLTEEEIWEQIDVPEVIYEDDGTAWVYYHSQRIEITDRFNDDGICRVRVSEGGKTFYMVIEYDGGYSIGTRRYLS